MSNSLDDFLAHLADSDECVGCEDDIEILLELIKDMTAQESLDFLSDGLALARCGIHSQEAVESVYNNIKGGSL